MAIKNNKVNSLDWHKYVESDKRQYFSAFEQSRQGVTIISFSRDIVRSFFIVDTRESAPTNQWDIKVFQLAASYSISLKSFLFYWSNKIRWRCRNESDVLQRDAFRSVNFQMRIESIRSQIFDATPI